MDELHLVYSIKYTGDLLRSRVRMRKLVAEWKGRCGRRRSLKKRKRAKTSSDIAPIHGGFMNPIEELKLVKACIQGAAARGAETL